MRIIKFLLKYFRLIIFNEYRESQLSKYISEEIKNLHSDSEEIQILDFGSGMNPIVIQKICESIRLKYKNIKLKVDCFDFYSNEQVSNLNKKFGDFNFYDLEDFDSSKKKYDFAIILDVLHHVGIDKNRKEVLQIFSDLSKTSKYVIVKDHFYSSKLSKYLLIAMDFVGNYYNNVSIPSTYFTEGLYDEILEIKKLKEIKRLKNKYYYKKYWLFFASPSLHFISIFTNKN